MFTCLIYNYKSKYRLILKNEKLEMDNVQIKNSEIFKTNVKTKYE